MDFDIIRKIKFNHLKASFETLALKHKFFLILFLISISATILPHEAFADQTFNSSTGPVLVFDMTNTDYQTYVEELSEDLTDQYYQLKVQEEVVRQKKLAHEVEIYLRRQGSPLADFTSILVSQRNWKKIVALANAESSLCRRYPVSLANCWGIGGADLWDMGSNLGEGVVAMNNFLNNYPRRSPVKYSHMSFERMNGLYKQPPAQHWIDNNQIVYDDMVAIENGL